MDFKRLENTKIKQMKEAFTFRGFLKRDMGENFRLGYHKSSIRSRPNNILDQKFLRLLLELF